MKISVFGGCCLVCLLAGRVDIRRALHPSAVGAALKQVRVDHPELVVAAAQDASGKTGATYATNPLLRGSPSNTAIPQTIRTW